LLRKGGWEASPFFCYRLKIADCILKIKQITKFNQQINNQDFFEASEELCKILKNESHCALENLSFEKSYLKSLNSDEIDEI
jgi:hypothetical protein